MICKTCLVTDVLQTLARSIPMPSARCIRQPNAVSDTDATEADSSSDSDKEIPES